jgi:hypothetical protein
MGSESRSRLKKSLPPLTHRYGERPAFITVGTLPDDRAKDPVSRYPAGEEETNGAMGIAHDHEKSCLVDAGGEQKSSLVG